MDKSMEYVEKYAKCYQGKEIPIGEALQHQVVKDVLAMYQEKEEETNVLQHEQYKYEIGQDNGIK
jgi:hypothetical protein